MMEIKVLFLLLLIGKTQGIYIRQKRELSEDPLITEGLFEGDIKGITYENLNDMITRSNDESRRASSPGAEDVASGAASKLFAVWPNKELYYEISNEFSQEQKDIIKNALNEYHQKTCIKMIQRTDQNDYVMIRNLVGCWSYVGKIGGSQDMSLGIGNGCVSKGVVIHEFMHALGFFHEQSRWDRDTYVEVKTENIRSDAVRQFEKMDLIRLRDLNTDYDYNSIMHYRNDAFSKNGQPTIVPRRSGVELGDKSSLSQIDVIELKKMYDCDISGPTPTQSPGGPIVPGVIQSGIRLHNHYTQYIVNNAEECKHKCRHDDQCAAMTYDSGNTYSFGNCFLTKLGYTATIDDEWSAWIKGKPKMGEVLQGMRLYGHYRQSHVHDVEACKQQCQRQIECAGMSYNPQRTSSAHEPNCYLMKKRYMFSIEEMWLTSIKGV